MAKPLAGKRIVVTRSPDLAEPMCEQLQALGAFPIRFPAIDFVPLPAPELDTALANLANYSWLIFTSGNGVRFFFERIDRFASRDWRLETDLRIAAIGAVTGRLLGERGVAVDFMPEVFTGEQLALGLGNIVGHKILLPRARIGRPEIVNLLQERGAIVDDVSLYDTVTACPTSTALLELQKGVDVITFTSPSCVRSFLQIMQPDESTLIACIGPSTADEAEQQGLTVAIVPDEYTIVGLITAVVDYFENALVH